MHQVKCGSLVVLRNETIAKYRQSIWCRICCIKFRHSWNQKRHMKNIHGGSMNLIKIRNSFMMLTEGTQFLTRILTCNQCKLTFHETKELKLNMKKVHSKFTCLPCNKTFTQKCRLTEHNSRIYSDRLFVCRFCTKRFTHLDTLKYHKKNGWKGVHK